MLLMSSLNVTLFFGGWLPPFKFLSFIPGSFWFSLKVSFFVILFIVVRAALPRYRYDQLMGLGWRVFFPVSLSYLVFTVCVLEAFNMMPYWKFDKFTRFWFYDTIKKSKFKKESEYTYIQHLTKNIRRTQKCCKHEIYEYKESSPA